MSDVSKSLTHPTFMALLATIEREVKYKDWTLHYDIDVRGGVLMYWKFNADDTSWNSRKWYVSAHATKSEIVLTAFKAVLTAEEHEAREHFTYKGEAVLGPHYNVDALIGLPLDLRPTTNDHETAVRIDTDHDSNDDVMPTESPRTLNGIRDVAIEISRSVDAMVDNLGQLDAQGVSMTRLMNAQRDIRRFIERIRQN